jgi:hypothetical protein
MKPLRSFECFALVLLISGCVGILNCGTASAQVAPDTPAMRTAKAIDAILYANFSQEERLARLKPYAAPMESMEDVQKRLEFGLCFGSGPGVMQCQVANSGLTLVFDPDKKLRLMRRKARVVNGVAYPEMSITDRGFKWNGYQRWYEN